MKAEIISVGTELLLGEITDTNASFLAGQLPALGIDLYWVSQVGDNRQRLLGVLKRAWKRSDFILITGGLGPTEDDLTREAIAEMLGEKPEVVPALECDLREFFVRRGIEMPLTNIKQATLIPSAEAIRNVQGTAPGWWVEKDKRILIAMPGPPREMQNVWHQEILPRLSQSTAGAIIVSRTIKTFGLSEAAVNEQVSSLLSSANPTLGVYAKIDGIHLRLAAKARNRKQAEEMIAPVEARVRSILKEYVWGTDNDTLEDVIGRMLTEKKLSLAVMEGYTGGLLTTTITDVPCAETYFKGGLIACSDEALIAYGVDAELISKYGVASVEVVQAMAEVARLQLGAAIGIGITGADESRETDNRPFSIIYTGIDDGNNKKTITERFPGDRAWTKQRAVTAALFELRRILGSPD